MNDVIPIPHDAKIIKTGNLTGPYLGEDFLNLELKGSAPIVDGLLWERDVSILLAKEKSCKSIVSQYFGLHLTSGHDFLGEFKIHEPVNVIYLQAEGKLAQTQQNIKRMLKVVPANMKRFLMLYYPAIAIDTPEGFQEVYRQIKAWNPPQAKNTVLIGDSLYMMLKGDMTNAQESKLFIGNMRLLAEEFQLTYWIMHHAHRDIKDLKHNTIDEGDNAIFGSFVWKAFPEHIILLRKKEKALKLSCDTQRSNEVMKEVNMILNEPDPLYFSIQENQRPCDDAVNNALKLMGKATRKELELKTGYSKTPVHNALQRLFIDEKVLREPAGKEFLWYPKP